MLRRRMICLGVLAAALAAPVAYADGCVTQAAMPAAQRDALVKAAMTFAAQAQNNDSAGIRANTIAAYAGDNFGGIQNAIAESSPNLKGVTFKVNSVWLLDATSLKPAPDGTLQDGQFFCALKGAVSEVSFVIPALPAGRYALAILESVSETNAWQLPMILQEVAGRWQMAGFFPHAMSAGGHDGLWYWKTARDFAGKKQAWNAWLYYQQAMMLLRPVSFMSSTHLDKLLDEMGKSAPHAVAQGVTASAPLALKAADGTDVMITGIGTDASLGTPMVDVAIHIKAEGATDQAAGRAKNRAAAMAFVAAYPEVRSAFHGVWVIADAQGQAPFATEEPMANLR